MKFFVLPLLVLSNFLFSGERLQHPTGPLPYHTEEVSFENGEISLAGTLTLPKGKNAFPTVLLIAGAGPSDRNQFGYGHKTFLVLADHLAQCGIASLRFDKRGVGGSTGEYHLATSGDFASDALSGIEYLKTLKQVHNIGVVGHSEGGAIAAVVAAESEDVAFVVSMAGPAVSGEKLLYEQGLILQKAVGIDQKRIKEDRKLRQKVFAIIKKEDNFQEIEKNIRKVVGKHFAKSSSHAKTTAAEGIAVLHPSNIEELLTRIVSPWFRYFLTFDSSKYLKQVQVPILALGAEKDLQVPPHQNIPAVEKALKSAKHTNFTIKVLPNLNHMFQTCQTGAISEYSSIEETIAPTALHTISDWILER